MPCEHITFLHGGHNPRTIARVTHIAELLDLGGLHRLPQHGQQMPLPLLPEQAIGHVVQMNPLPGLRVPSATGGNEVHMGSVLAIAPMRLIPNQMNPTTTLSCVDQICTRRIAVFRW
jgi:hypothetical protein